jgi:hypothetical protein
LSDEKGHFFDIPIYRCDIEVHTKEMAKKREKHLDYFKKPPLNASDEIIIEFGHRWDRETWTSWWYNEIIGWIDLRVEWDQIKGHLWEIKTSRPRWGTYKEFVYVGDYIKIRPSPENTSGEISNLIMKELDEIRKLPRFKKRYFYFDAFNKMRPFVDWRGLMGLGRNQQRFGL